MRKYQKLICGVIMSLFCIILVNSCGVRIEKRRYNRGFHVSINTKKNFKNVSKKIENENYISENKTLFHQTEDSQDSNTVNGFTTKETLTSSSTVGLSKEYKSNADIESLKLYEFERAPSTTNHNKGLEIEEHSFDQSNKKQGSDKYLYLLAGLMGITSISIIKSARTKTKQLSRWASNNKKKALLLLICTQFGLAYSGFGLGDTLKNAGIIFSSNTHFFSEILGGLSLISIAFFKKNLIGFFNQKIGYAFIGVSLFLSSVSIGNSTNYNEKSIAPPIAFAVYKTIPTKKNDKRVTLNNSEIDQSVDRLSSPKGYGAVIAVWIIFAILLTLIFAGLTCMTFCTYGSLGWLAVLGSILLLGLFNWGMVAWRRRVLYGPRKKKSTAS